MSSAAKPRDPLRLQAQLCFSLYAASRLVVRQYQPLLAPLGLTYPQYIVLLVLWADAPCSVSHIGAQAQLASNTLTPLLKRLAQLGYVTRQRSPEDERVLQVGLTPAGRALKARCAHIPMQLLDGIAYPRQAARALKTQLDALVTHLQALPERSEPDRMD